MKDEIMFGYEWLKAYLLLDIIPGLETSIDAWLIDGKITEDEVVRGRIVLSEFSNLVAKWKSEEMNDEPKKFEEKPGFCYGWNEE